MSIGSITAVARHCRNKRKPLRVLWLDAHTDFNTRELSPSGSLHGMPLSCLCGFDPRELLQIGGATPALSAKWVRQIGIRSVDTGERRFVHEQQLEVFDMRFIDEMGVRQTMELALQDLDPDTHLHVSFDVDFLDPEIAPGVGTTVPWRVVLPRSTVVHGNDCGHGPDGLVGYNGTESSPGCAEQDRGARRRFGRIPVREEHFDAKASVICEQARKRLAKDLRPSMI